MAFIHSSYAWTFPDNIAPQLFRRLAQDVRAIIAASDVPLQRDFDDPAPPLTTCDVISLNGVGIGRHETLRIIREPGRYHCSTAGKPYDVVVTAALLAARARFGSAFQVDSIGTPSVEEDWSAGRVLLGKAVLTSAQAQMLRRLSKCEASYETGHRLHWSTVRQLEAQGLVFVDGGAGGWDVGITDAGRLVLAALGH